MSQQLEQPTGNRNDLFWIESLSFFGDTKYWSPEVAEIVKDGLENACFAEGQKWEMLTMRQRQALVLKHILVQELRHGLSESRLQALRMVEFCLADATY